MSGKPWKQSAIACRGGLVCSNIHTAILTCLEKRLKKLIHRAEAKDLLVTVAP